MDLPGNVLGNWKYDTRILKKLKVKDIDLLLSRTGAKYQVEF
jgi:hypothetical protein